MNGIEITYRREGDVLLPILETEEAERSVNLTKFGLLRKQYLKEQFPARYNSLCMTEELMRHCLDIQEQALEMKDTLTEQLRRQYKPPEKTDFMANVRYNNQISDMADEIVIREIVYGK
jgi:hypothetical protein